MREWKAADIAMQCGAVVGCAIRPGQRYCLVGAMKLKRCELHAPPADGEAESAASTPPDDQPGKPLRVPEFSSVKHLAEAAERDVKMAQAGERDDE
jgi:hypothetical protein